MKREEFQEAAEIIQKIDNLKVTKSQFEHALNQNDRDENKTPCKIQIHLSHRDGSLTSVTLDARDGLHEEDIEHLTASFLIKSIHGITKHIDSLENRLSSI